MKLHVHPLSGHAHRARLFAGLIGADVQLQQVDLAAGAHKSASFLRLNPFGQVPVLEDGDTVIADSNAILVYLAKKHGRSDWLPEDPVGAARVQRWLSVAAGQIASGPAATRLINVFNAPYDAEEVIGRAHAILALIEQTLGERDWIAVDRPTIADVALYSYIARAPEGNVSLADYPSIRAWLKELEQMPGFVPFQKTPVGLEVVA
jgi:glutathione S-transferase